MDLENILLDAVRINGRHLRTAALVFEGLEWKHDDDPVTDHDRAVEHDLRERLGAVIDADFVGEELADTANGHDKTIYIDPIDGTKSFIRGEYNSAISVAVEDRGVLTHGVVHDFMRGLTYYADQRKAYLAHDTEEGTKKVALPRATLLRKVTIDMEQDQGALADSLRMIDVSIRKGSGGVSLRMAQAAAGVYDGLIMAPSDKGGVDDIAAGAYLLMRAGLRVTDFEGMPYDHRTPERGIIALNGRARTLYENASRLIAS